MKRAALVVTLLLTRAVPDALAQHTVSGTAFDTAGAPLNGSVRLVVRSPTALPGTTTRATAVTADGAFTLTNVPPGEYLVQALAAGGFGRPAEFGVADVSVKDRDPSPIRIRVSAGAVLEGLILVEGQPQSRAATVSLMAVPFDKDRAPEAGHGTLAIYGDGRFYLTGLYGRTRLVLSTTSEGWYFKSVTIGGVDATYTGFDFGFAEDTFRDAFIQIAHATGVISGRVVSESGRAGSSSVIVFATDEQKWFATSSYVKRVQPSPDGSFRVDGLPPGNYFVAAVDLGNSPDPSSWPEPEALRALRSAALRVTLRESGAPVTELRLSRSQTR